MTFKSCLSDMHCNPELVQTLPRGAVHENANAWISWTGHWMDVTTPLPWYKVHVMSNWADVWIEPVRSREFTASKWAYWWHFYPAFCTLYQGATTHLNRSISRWEHIWHGQSSVVCYTSDNVWRIVSVRCCEVWDNISSSNSPWSKDIMVKFTLQYHRLLHLTTKHLPLQATYNIILSNI